eukprot:snap_masked-scaffold_1-processed-gene-2.28-mRNA-1 protein AED:0.02 eAED:0.02 QI:0/-1/0/1/-1/1/1/0/140
MQKFFGCKSFAVVGASSNTSKYGYKVLKAYSISGMDVSGINPKGEQILDKPCFKSLTDFMAQGKNGAEVGVSVITPPKISEKVIEEANNLGVKNIWLQPGAENADCVQLGEKYGLNLIHSGPCVLVEIGKGSHKEPQSAI